MMGKLQATEWLAGTFYEQYYAFLIHFTSNTAPLVTPCTCQASHVYQARYCTGEAPRPQGDIGCIIDSEGDLHSESWEDTVVPFAYNFGRIYCGIDYFADKESDYLGVRFLVYSALSWSFKTNNRDERLRIA